MKIEKSVQISSLELMKSIFWNKSRARCFYMHLLNRVCIIVVSWRGTLIYSLVLMQFVWKIMSLFLIIYLTCDILSLFWELWKHLVCQMGWRTVSVSFCMQKIHRAAIFWACCWCRFNNVLYCTIVVKCNVFLAVLNTNVHFSSCEGLINK